MKSDTKLSFVPLGEHPELVCESIQQLVENYDNSRLSHQILVAEIDPEFAGGLDLCSHYNIQCEKGANCVVVEATRAQSKQFAACIYPVGSRVDMNKAVRKQLYARRVSLAQVDEVIEKTGMEYGSITPIGLPKDWLILIDSSILCQEKIIIGSGKLHSKLCISTALLVQLTNASILSGLAQKL
jgi:prolyl-tRNA editing enzyme YbaK/EbsC (Cys-tRNA(Pro) deacylase)